MPSRLETKKWPNSWTKTSTPNIKAKMNRVTTLEKIALTLFFLSVKSGGSPRETAGPMTQVLYSCGGNLAIDPEDYS